MKLEPDLLKEILIYCEENLPDKKRVIKASEIIISNYQDKEILFHVKLLYENGYLDCIDLSSHDGEDYFIKNLTMNGYQYLHLLRSKAWNTAKGLLHETGVIFAEAAIKAVIDKVSVNLF